MANKKNDRDGRFQIKANKERMRLFDIECKKAGTNRSARISILIDRDITPAWKKEQARADELEAALTLEHNSLCAYLDYAPANLRESCYDPYGAYLAGRNALAPKGGEK